MLWALCSVLCASVLSLGSCTSEVGIHTRTYIYRCWQTGFSPVSLAALASEIPNQEFLKLYDHPNVSQLEAVLLKRITEDEARHILFFPDEDQAAYYRTLIADPPPGAPAEHPQRAVQVRIFFFFVFDLFLVGSGNVGAFDNAAAHDQPGTTTINACTYII